MHRTRPTERKSELDKALLLLGLFREFRDTMPTQTAVIFLEIAKKDGITTQELVEKVGLSTAAIGRNRQNLEATNRQGEAGFGLVYAAPAADIKGRLRIYLTP